MKTLLPLLAIPILLAGCKETPEHSATLMTSGDAEKGKSHITRYGCGNCHIIPGIRGAKGLVGPSLEHIANRHYIGGVVQNTPANLVRWILDPPSVDEKTAMPKLHVKDSEAMDIARYLYTLK